jgi:hypothetical protein
MLPVSFIHTSRLAALRLFQRFEPFELFKRLELFQIVVARLGFFSGLNSLNDLNGFFQRLKDLPSAYANMTGSGLSCELFVNHLGNFLFYLEISTCFITGAEPAYHGGITVELTSNFNCFHAAPFARQVRKLRAGLCPRALPSRRSEFFDSVTMNFGNSVQQFFKPQLSSARSDLSLRQYSGLT